MRLRTLVCVAIAASAIAAAHPAAAAPLPTDQMCPRAVPKIVALNDAAASLDKGKIATAARGAADAYSVCASEAQVAKGVAIEPTVNYDKTRAAQYFVVVGRALAASGNTAEAGAALKTARQYADDVIGWQPESISWHASQTSGGPVAGEGMAPTGGNTAARNPDRDGSRYKDVARQILSAADQELAKLGLAPSSVPAKPN
jgi:hypothetical protein